MSNLTRLVNDEIPTSGVIIITGTDTGVGKTVASAAVASVLASLGIQAYIYKPVQTGLMSIHHPQRSELEELYGGIMVHSDAQVAGELAGCSYSTGATFALPMAPRAAAAAAQQDLPTADEHAARIAQLLQDHAVVIVEGAGGLLVDLGDCTLAAIAGHLQDEFHLAVHVLVVVRTKLGTLNHTALTIEALRSRGLHKIGVVIGSWPALPMPVELSNREELEQSYPVIATIPAGAGALGQETFQEQAPTWFATG